MKSKFNILLLYKNSTYATYFLSGISRLRRLREMFRPAEIQKFKQTHDCHFKSLFYIEDILMSKHLSYTKICRGRHIDYSRFNLIITVGGDGTFLEAARHIKNTLILGVNSDPTWSVGNFCSAHMENFQEILEAILVGRQKIRIYQRLALKIPKQPTVQVLNDVLFCHSNPAAISRYYLAIGKQKEDHRGSGLWVSTAVGSSAAIHSAGGQLLAPESKQFQYRARELYSWKNTQYSLTGGVLALKKSLNVTSLMRGGVIFADGSHHKITFPFGSSAQIAKSAYPLKVVWSS